MGGRDRGRAACFSGTGRGRSPRWLAFRTGLWLCIRNGLRRSSMKRVFLLSLFVSAGLWAQTAPSAYTTNYRIRQWASGANPSADSLNANWTLIDTKIRAPGYILPDSVIIGAATSPSGVDLYVDGIARMGSQLLVDDSLIVGLTASLWAGPPFRVFIEGTLGIEDAVYVGVPSTASGWYRLYGASDAYAGIIGRATLTDNRTWTLPNVAGTFGFLAGDQDFTDMGDVTLDALTIGGTITSGGVAGEGTVDISVIVDTVSRVAQSGSISATNLTNTTATGIYRVSVYLETDNLDAGQDSILATIAWEGDDGENITEATSYLAMTATTSNLHKTFFINHTGAGSVAIQWSTTAEDNDASDYLIKIVAERLN